MMYGFLNAILNLSCLVLEGWVVRFYCCFHQILVSGLHVLQNEHGSIPSLSILGRSLSSGIRPSLKVWEILTANLYSPELFIVQRFFFFFYYVLSPACLFFFRLFIFLVLASVVHVCIEMYPFLQGVPTCWNIHFQSIP